MGRKGTVCGVGLGDRVASVKLSACCPSCLERKKWGGRKVEGGVSK